MVRQFFGDGDIFNNNLTLPFSKKKNFKRNFAIGISNGKWSKSKQENMIGSN